MAIGYVLSVRLFAGVDGIYQDSSAILGLALKQRLENTEKPIIKLAPESRFAKAGVEVVDDDRWLRTRRDLVCNFADGKGFEQLGNIVAAKMITSQPVC